RGRSACSRRSRSSASSSSDETTASLLCGGAVPRGTDRRERTSSDLWLRVESAAELSEAPCARLESDVERESGAGAPSLLRQAFVRERYASVRDLPRAGACV